MFPYRLGRCNDIQVDTQLSEVGILKNLNLKNTKTVCYLLFKLLHKNLIFIVFFLALEDKGR